MRSRRTYRPRKHAVPAIDWLYPERKDSCRLALTTPGFATTKNGLSILLATSLIAVVAVGETFVVVTGGIDLSIGSNVALTGIVTGLALDAGLPVPAAVVLAIVTAGLGAADCRDGPGTQRDRRGRHRRRLALRR
jgi:hypothetical protein